MSLDLDSLVAIDVHTHTHASIRASEPDPVTQEFLAAAARYFGGDPPQPTVQDVADYYRERKLAAVVFTVDSDSGTGQSHVSNEEVFELAAANADVLIPFASIDPHKGKRGVELARRYVSEHGVRGFKFHPNTQAFWPDDRAFYPLYEVIAEAGAIALFHSGTTGIGAGMPGGGGVHLKYSNPMAVDDVAADFPSWTSSWRIRASPGRTRRSRSPRISRTCTSTSRAGRRSTSPSSSCATRTRSSSTRCCSAPTFR